MTQNLNDRKYRLIQQIINLEDESALSKLEHQVTALQQVDDQRFLEAIKPVEKSITLDEMIAHQHYTPPTKETFFSQTEDLEWDESLEELLEMLD